MNYPSRLFAEVAEDLEAAVLHAAVDNIARAYHRVLVSLSQPAFPTAEGAADHRAGDEPDGHVRFPLQPLLAINFGLRQHRHSDALAAIRLIGDHFGIVAVDHRPVVADRGLVAASGQSKGQSD